MNINDTLTLAVAGMDDTRSKFRAAGYTAPIYTDKQLTDAYKGSSLVARVVDMPVEDTFREWREWQAEADQITAIEDVESRLCVKRCLSRAYRDARLFGDGYVYLDNGEDVTEPLEPETAAPLRFSVRVARWQISEGPYNYDPLSPGYGRPSYYDIMGADASVLQVHPSRIVHLVGREVIDDGQSSRMGMSVVAAMFYDLKAVDAVMSNIADMTFEAKVDVMKIRDLMGKVRDPEELSAIQSKLQLSMYTKSVNGALIMDMEDEDWQAKQLSFATLPDIIDRFQIAAAGAAQIPRSKLFGVQTGGLGDGGISDAKSYYDRISSIQENEIQPACSIFDDMIIKTALGVIPPEVHYNWRSLWQMDDKQKAEIGESIVKKYADAVNAGIFAPDFATEPLVNELTEAGVSPGLEAAFNTWMGELSDDPVLGIIEP